MISVRDSEGELFYFNGLSLEFELEINYIPFYTMLTTNVLPTVPKFGIASMQNI